MLSVILQRYGATIEKGGASTAGAGGARTGLDDPRKWAPSPQLVLDVLAAWPNTGETLPTHDDFVRAMAAIKAALGPDCEEHYGAVEDWALGYPGNEGDYVRKIWESLYDTKLGWDWLCSASGSDIQAQIDFGDVPQEWQSRQDAEGNTETAKVKRPPILRLAALCEANEARDFVEDLLCDEQISVWSGEPNAGKTFTAIDLALHVSLGWTYHGRDVERGGVIYVAGEGASGIKQRVAAFRQKHGFDKTADAWFGVVPYAIDFRDRASVDGLISAVAEEASNLGGHVRLIVVDTLSRALAGGDENSSVDMGALVAAADRIRLATGAHVMFIHHTGKDPSKGARGHSLLRGNVDTEVMVERGEAAGSIIARVTKQRDLECAGVLSLRLRQVKLGTNRRGKPITSCVVETAEMPRPKLSENASTALLVLNEMLPDDLSGCGAGVTCGVEINAWREAVMKRLEEEGVTNPVSRRVQFKRAKDALLINGGRITISDGHVDLAL